MAKPPPVGATSPPPIVQPDDKPVAARTKETVPLPEQKALVAALASTTKYCESSPKLGTPIIMRCDAGAGRFAGTAKELQGLRWREGEINGLPVSFVPAGYDGVAAGAAKGYMVLELDATLQSTYGRFVAVKIEDYQGKNHAAFIKLGTPVTIDRSLLAESEGSAKTPENFPAYLQQALSETRFPADVVNVRVAMEDGKLRISFDVEWLGGALPTAKMAAIKQQVQEMVRKQAPLWGLPQLVVTIQSSVVDSLIH